MVYAKDEKWVWPDLGIGNLHDVRAAVKTELL
jgi:hypothetical protein